MEKTITLTSLNNIELSISKSDGPKKIQISDSLYSINVVGDAVDNSIVDQLIEFNSGNYLYEIQPKSFINCKQLSSVILKPSTRNIGNEAFKNCENLEQINLDIGYFDYIGDNAFENVGIDNLNITLINSMNGNSYFGNKIFSNCKKLKTATVKTNYIPANMFDGSDKLTHLNLYLSSYNLDKTTYVDENALSNINSLEHINLVGEFDTVPLMQNNTKLKEVKLSAVNNEGYKIPSYCFANTPKLTTLSVDDSVIDINQLEKNALTDSSITTLYLNGITYDQLISNKNVENPSTFDKCFKVAKNYGSYQNRDENEPGPILTRMLENENDKDENGNKIYYYGKIYNDVSAVVEYALKNKLPCMIFNSLNTQCNTAPFYKKRDMDVDSRHMFSTKLFYDWLEQQKALVCMCGCNDSIQNKNLHMKYPSIVTDYYNYTYDKYEIKNNQIKKTTKYTYCGPFVDSRYISHPGVIWRASHYSGEGYDEGIYDGSSNLIIYDNNRKIKRIYKFGNSNLESATQLTYDLTTGKFGKKTTNQYRVKQFSTTKMYSTPAKYSYIWPYRWSLLIINPTENIDLTPTKYKDHPYMKYKNVDKNYCNIFGNVIDSNVGNTWNERYGDVEIVDITNCNIRFLNVWFTSMNKLPTYTLMVGDKTYDEYFSNIPEHIPEKIDGQTYYKLNPEWLENKHLYNKRKEFNTSKYSNKYDCTSNYGLKTTLTNLTHIVDECISNHTRNPKFNDPTYVKKDINLDFIETKKTPFDCWGIDHDCQIYTADNKKCKWDSRQKKLILLTK